MGCTFRTQSFSIYQSYPPGLAPPLPHTSPGTLQFYKYGKILWAYLSETRASRLLSTAMSQICTGLQTIAAKSKWNKPLSPVSMLLQSGLDSFRQATLNWGKGGARLARVIDEMLNTNYSGRVLFHLFWRRLPKYIWVSLRLYGMRLTPSGEMCMSRLYHGRMSVAVKRQSGSRMWTRQLRGELWVIYTQKHLDLPYYCLKLHFKGQHRIFPF